MWIFSNDTNAEFGLPKFATKLMRRGQLARAEGIWLPSGEIMKAIQLQPIHKYLEILESDRIKHHNMKKKTKREYIRRVRKILTSRLKAINIILAINSRAVVQYGAGILKWREVELKEMNRK